MQKGRGCTRDARSSYLNFPGIQTILNSLAAVRASSPKKRNLYPTSTTRMVSLCLRLMSTTCFSRGVSFFAFPFVSFVGAGAGAAASSSSSSPSTVSTSAAEPVPRPIPTRQSGPPSLLTNFSCRALFSRQTEPPVSVSLSSVVELANCAKSLFIGSTGFSVPSCGCVSCTVFLAGSSSSSSSSSAGAAGRTLFDRARFGAGATISSSSESSSTCGMILFCPGVFVLACVRAGGCSVRAGGCDCCGGLAAGFWKKLDMVGCLRFRLSGDDCDIFWIKLAWLTGSSRSSLR